MENALWKIKNIRLEGLLNRHDLFWELKSNVNILGGKNGSGKSTLLHSLAFLLQTYLNDITLDDKHIHCDALFKSLTIELNSGASLTAKRTADVTQETITESPFASKIRVREKISLETSVNKPESVDDIEFARHILYINSAEIAVSTISKFIENTADTKRPARTTLDLLLEQTLNARNQIFAQRMSQAMANNDNEQVDALRDYFGRFESAVHTFMPEYKLIDPSTLTFSPLEDAENEYRFFRLSTGEKELLYILLTVANTLGESTILLLDEADLGMHIDWKKILLRELLTINPNMQIIAATHAPSLINGWYDNVKEITELYSV